MFFKRRKRDLSAHLYAGNLTFDATEEMLTAAISPIAPVEEVFIARNEAGLFMGYAFVRMRSVDDVSRVVEQLHGKPIGARDCFLTPATDNADLWSRAASLRDR
ncbi:MAG: RNA recognition motif domain-containing protein [Kofleriaceae bacterium]